MKTISIDAVANILGIHKSRIEQWISREQFLPRIGTSQGKKRGWDQGEVIRLAVFAKLASDISLLPARMRVFTPEEISRLTAEEAGRLTQFGLHGFVDEGAFFVCYKTESEFDWLHEVVRKSDIGPFLTGGCFIPKVLMEGYSAEARRHNSDDHTGRAKMAVIIDLDDIERQLLEAWPQTE